MEGCHENDLKKLCCTCLSTNRKLFQLCRITDGVNSLYLLLSYDTEAYREGFYKDTANLYICWECEAIVRKICRFRQQACNAQKYLTDISDGRADINTQKPCLSRLSRIHTTSYLAITSEAPPITIDNFIDCGPPTEIKTDSDDDLPLSEFITDHETETNDTESLNPNNLCLQTGYNSDVHLGASIQELYTPHVTLNSNHIHTLSKTNKTGANKKIKLKNGTKLKKYFTTVVIGEGELNESRVSRKKAVEYVDAVYKCDSCIQVFDGELEFETHNSSLHVAKEELTPCDICLTYLNPINLQDHRLIHYNEHICKLCDKKVYNLDDVLAHLKNEHGIRITGKRKMDDKYASDVATPGAKHRRNQSADKKTPYGYSCPECNTFFDNKNQRWKHVQRHHREGYKCSTCGKRFAFKNNLTRHEQLHKAPPPREECPTCHKMIRVDLIKTHSRIHSAREKFECAACDKCFVSRASYEHHLKYTQMHAAGDILKYKCPTCEKGYRSRGELRDHVNYQHMGKTRHKCPICGKALATRRCITRHVRRAHDGVKESARDKICQQCGKAFRDKKGLREHEAIHTGERPLACELCGATFRQSASLYTHRRRVHRLRTRRARPTYCAEPPL